MLFELGVVGMVAGELVVGDSSDDALCTVTCLEVEGSADIPDWQSAERGGKCNGNTEEEAVSFSATVYSSESRRPGWSGPVFVVCTFGMLTLVWFIGLVFACDGCGPRIGCVDALGAGGSPLLDASTTERGG